MYCLSVHFNLIAINTLIAANSSVANSPRDISALAHIKSAAVGKNSVTGDAKKYGSNFCY
jgi:hypothetical protein